jgi:hypothetical protein
MALKAFVEMPDGQQIVSQYLANQGNQAILLNNAKLLGQEPGQLLEAIEKDPDTVVKRIYDKAKLLKDPESLSIVASIDAKQLTGETLKKQLSGYMGEHAQPWHPDAVTADLVKVMGDEIGDWLVEKYNIKPDGAVTRLSTLLKGVQSFFVLNLNPLYFINNTGNNMVTRAAQGVFGYMTPRQIGAYWNRFGMKPPRLDVGIGAAGEGTETGGRMAVAKATWASNISPTNSGSVAIRVRRRSSPIFPRKPS